VNQYGFINTRSIRNAWLCPFEYLYIYNKSRKELVILKLNFEKAFDRIEHVAMLDIMEKKGFKAKWIFWMKLTFSMVLLQSF